MWIGRDGLVRVGCSDLVKAGFVEPKDYGGCCGSCHDDADYGYDLCTFDYDNERGIEGRLCCSLALYLEKHPLTDDQCKQLVDSCKNEPFYKAIAEAERRNKK